MEDISSFQEVGPEVFPEKISVSPRLDVIGVPLEHDLKEWGRYETSLEIEIRKADGVIFEYFPDEMQDWERNPLVQQFYDVNLFLPFFEKLAEAVQKQGKKAYVLDPAHDQAFLWVRGLPYGLIGAGSAAVGKSLWDRFRTSKMSRRQFLVNLGLAASGVVAVGSGVAGGPSSVGQEKITGNPTTRLSETDFRRTVVAKGIVQLAEGGLENTNGKNKLLVVYPPVHWKGIRGLLENRGELNRKFAIYSTAKKVIPEEHKDSLFSIRAYSWNGNSWQKISTTPIK